MSKTTNNEPLLSDNDDRFVMFPIEHTIYGLCIKNSRLFLREEIDLSKDLLSWKTLDDNEQYFIKISLFLLSDGIVLENWGIMFMKYK